MENQHRKISGYRELTQEEIDLMNRIKAFGPELETLIADVEMHLTRQARMLEVDVLSEEYSDELSRINKAEPQKWVELAKTDLQVGLMKLTRSIAQPGFF